MSGMVLCGWVGESECVGRCGVVCGCESECVLNVLLLACKVKRPFCPHYGMIISIVMSRDSVSCATQ